MFKKSNIVKRISELNEIYQYIVASKTTDVLRWLESRFWKISDNSELKLKELMTRDYLVFRNQIWEELKLALDIFFGLLDSGFQINDQPIPITGRICQLIIIDYYVQILEGSIIFEESSIVEGAVILNKSHVPPGLVIPARAVMNGIPVEIIREQSRNDILEQKERAHHYSQLFIKIKNHLPNAQSYLLTFPDFIKLLLKKED